MNNPQRADIARRLEDLAKSKLPSPRYIRHEGFRLTALTEAYRIRRAKPDEWQDLILRAYAIPNSADRALVLSTVALALPAGLGHERARLIADAMQTIANIPSAIDQVERYFGLATQLSASDSVLGREVLRAAMQCTAKTKKDAASYQRRIVDLAYRLGSDFAQSLAEAVDDDAAKRHVKRRLQLLELRKKLIDEESGKPDLPSPVDYPHLGWLLVSGLRSGRLGHLRLASIRGFLEATASQPLSSSYAALLWVIENSVARFADTPQAATYLRPMFDATIVGAQLAGQISGRALVQLRGLKAGIAGAEDSRVKSVPAGTREEALEFLRDWFQNEVGSYLKICDQYFAPADLAILALLRSARPGCKVEILTSRRHQPALVGGMSLEDMYTSYWNVHISDQSPPETTVAVIGSDPGGESPIHDRWLRRIHWARHGSQRRFHHRRH